MSQILNQDCIIALSTNVGGAICIIRLSGSGCQDLALGTFRTPAGRKKSSLKHACMNYGFIVDPCSLEKIDEVYLVAFDKQRSYTGEEMVEIHCHGSKAIIEALSELFVKRGVRPAEPGEFTKRAFIHGRVGLSQAEAVHELIHAETLAQSKIAINNLSGNVRTKIGELRARIVDSCAKLEATLDYPEEDIDFIDSKALLQDIIEIQGICSNILENYTRYTILRDGVSVAILGEPNAGKSSLLNALLKEDRAIVTSIEGTTRDHIEESFVFENIKYRLIDTAGIRETEDVVEKLGVEKSLNFEKDAQFRLYIYDGTKPQILRQAAGESMHLLNKEDLGLHPENQTFLKEENCFAISVKENHGITDFLKVLNQKSQGLCAMHEDLITLTSSRQANSIDQAISSLEHFGESLNARVPMDVALVDLYEAIDFLGQITGEIVSDDIIDRIFEKFCIGK